MPALLAPVLSRMPCLTWAQNLLGLREELPGQRSADAARNSAEDAAECFHELALLALLESLRVRDFTRALAVQAKAVG